MIFLTSRMTRCDTSFMRYVCRNSKTFLKSHSVITTMIMPFRSCIGAMELTLSMTACRTGGSVIPAGMAIFFPAMILSTSGMIMPRETPLKAEVATMQSPARASTPACG